MRSHITSFAVLPIAACFILFGGVAASSGQVNQPPVPDLGRDGSATTGPRFSGRRAIASLPKPAFGKRRQKTCIASRLAANLGAKVMNLRGCPEGPACFSSIDIKAKAG